MNDGRGWNFARRTWFPWLITLTLFGITQIPFWLGHLWAPPGTVFDGLTGMVADQQMYFSFIRQAAEGHWLFENRLTHVAHRPAMFNLEWLLVGWLSALLGQAAAYQLWRFCGTVLLVWGAWFLLGAVGRSGFQKSLALVLIAFGGGFGWLFQLLDAARIYQGAPLGKLDVADGLCFPFAQVLLNPHVTVSHGLSLFSLGWLIWGERKQSGLCTLAGGLLAAVNGLVRPYDLIVLFAALPLFVVVDACRTRTVSPHTMGRQLLPLFLTGPVLLYYVLLFQYHPVFRYWSSQGIVETLGLQWQLVNLGLGALLAVLRLASLRRIPWASAGEVLVAVWIAAALFLFHAHRLPFFDFMPYTPLLGSTLGSLLLILASALFPVQAPWQVSQNARQRTWAILLCVGLVGVNSCSSLIWMVKIPRNLARMPDHYLPVTELAACERLDRYTFGNSVVLSTLPTGNRMARFVSARFVLGHINVTPNVLHLSEQVAEIYRGELSPREAEDRLEQWNVRWIVRGPAEAALGAFDFDRLPGAKQGFHNDFMTIWEYAPPDDE